MLRGIIQLKTLHILGEYSSAH